jgi:hypothetical protein
MYPTDMFEIIGIWVALLLMLMIYSYPLWKENPVYRFAENTFVSSSMAILLIVALQNTNRIAIQPLLNGQVHYIIPILLGVAMYSLLVPQHRYLSRYPIAVLVGAAFGLGMRGVLIPNIINQVVTTITPPSGGDMMSWINFTFIAFGTICSLMYFFLSYEHKGTLEYPTRIGRLIIMLGLGAYFGNTVLFRFAMLTGRAQYLLQVLGILPM